MNLATISHSLNPMDAQLVRARLEVAGFHPVVNHELAALTNGGYSVAVGGIKVQVPAEELDEARAFLAAETSPLNENQS